MDFLKDKSIEELARLAKNGSKLALGELSRRLDLQRLIYRAIRGVDVTRKLNEQDEEDIIRMVLTKIAEKIVSFKGRSKFTTWAYKIAYREAKDQTDKKLRKLKLETPLGELDEDYIGVSAGSRTIEGKAVKQPPTLTPEEEKLEQHQRIKLLRKVIQEGLDESEIIVLARKELFGEPLEKIARDMGISTSRCYELYEEGKIKFRKRYLLYYYGFKKWNVLD